MGAIKGTDLRVGNIVYSKHHKMPVNVKAVFANAVQLYENPIPFYTMEEIEGIPITPEILEKAGFVLNGFKEYEIVLPKKLQTHECKLSFTSDYLYMRQGRGKQPSREDDLICLWNKDVMKQWHLHQLQNLYYSLTATELTIKL